MIPALEWTRPKLYKHQYSDQMKAKSEKVCQHGFLCHVISERKTDIKLLKTEKELLGKVGLGRLVKTHMTLTAPLNTNHTRKAGICSTLVINKNPDPIVLWILRVLSSIYSRHG